MNANPTATSTSGLAAAFCMLPTGEVVGGQICSFKENEISLRFPVRGAIPLGVAIPIRLTVSGAGTSDPIKAVGVRRLEQGLGQEYVFRHETPTEQLPDFLRQVVERRKSIRYQPSRPVIVDFEYAKGQFVQGTLVDVSREGCGFVGDTETERTLASAAQGRVRFRLETGSYAVNAVIRRRELVERDTILYGLQFHFTEATRQSAQERLDQDLGGMRPVRVPTFRKQ